MLTIVLTILVGLTNADRMSMSSRETTVNAVEPRSALRDALLQKLRAMSDAEQGVFHEDVTSIAAPYFPAGQTFADAERTLAAQKLGPLRHFHGKADGADSAVYVSHADLMSEMFADVSLVLDFEFAGKTERDMTLKKVTAFLQAASM